MPNDTKRVAAIGFGAMTRSIIASLRRGGSDIEIGAVLVRGTRPVTEPGAPSVMIDIGELIAWKPSLVVECAGHSAVRDSVPTLLGSGFDVIVGSIGALAEAATLRKLKDAAERGGARMQVVAGAIGGLDALRAAALAGLDEVAYIGTKPPNAWLGTRAEAHVDLRTLSRATVFFDGNAAVAARDYPKNANVTAAVALAGIGFELTRVTLVADPEASTNLHEVTAAGPFGRLSITLGNTPLPGNPRTSWLAALSVEQGIRQHFERLML